MRTAVSISDDVFNEAEEVGETQSHQETVLAKGTAGLAKTSVVNVTQIATVDKAALFEETSSN